EGDVYYFREGTHARLYRVLGAHPAVVDDTPGVRFAVWAPNAEHVSVIGDFNGWNKDAHPLRPRSDASGIWQAFGPGLDPGSASDDRTRPRYDGHRVDQAAPCAFSAEQPPQTASRVVTLDYEWGDADWMAGRQHANSLAAPWSIYEVHLGSWRRS